MPGDGSPTALQGNTMSLIQGVVTVLLKVRIRAGAAGKHTHTHIISTQNYCCSSLSFGSGPSAVWVRAAGSGVTLWWWRGHPSPPTQTGQEHPKEGLWARGLSACVISLSVLTKHVQTSPWEYTHVFSVLCCLLNRCLKMWHSFTFRTSGCVANWKILFESEPTAQPAAPAKCNHNDRNLNL